MRYADQPSIEAGLLFKTHSGLLVRTTGHTVYIQSVNKCVHQVVIVAQTGKGNEFLLNLDAAKPVDVG